MAVEPRIRRVMQLDNLGLPVTPKAIIIDDYTTADTTYFCFASVGTIETASTWRIMKLTVSTGFYTWADGNSNYDNKASDRASLTYS